LPTVKEIALDEIDEADETFRISVAGGLEELERSIAAVGQTSPLHVRARADGLFQLVTGFRRLEVLKRLGKSRALAFLHSLEELTDDRAARLAVFDNIGVRSYNLVEQARSVELLIGLGAMSPAEVAREVLPAFGLQPHGQVVELLKKLLGLEPEALELVAEMGWTARSVLPLADWKPADRKALFEVLRALRPGTSRFSELASSLEEIALGRRRPLEEVIRELGLKEIALDEVLPLHERFERVRRRVREARYPTLVELERRARRLVEELGLEPEVSIEPPEGFEGDGYQVRFSFVKPEELRRKATILLEASSRPAASELGRLLTGEEGP
jgi:hypothetical protein